MLHHYYHYNFYWSKRSQYFIHYLSSVYMCTQSVSYLVPMICKSIQVVSMHREYVSLSSNEWLEALHNARLYLWLCVCVCVRYTGQVEQIIWPGAKNDGNVRWPRHLMAVQISLTQLCQCSNKGQTQIAHRTDDSQTQRERNRKRKTATQKQDLAVS